MKFLNFFLFLWIIFALLEPDPVPEPDPLTWLNPDPIRSKPDPKHWFFECILKTVPCVQELDIHFVSVYFVDSILRRKFHGLKPDELGSYQCCRSGMFIPDPGSWFLHIPDPGSRIQKKQQREGWKKNCCHTIFCSHKSHKIVNYFIFEMLKKIILANFQGIIEHPKNCQ